MYHFSLPTPESTPQVETYSLQTISVSVLFIYFSFKLNLLSNLIGKKKVAKISF